MSLFKPSLDCMLSSPNLGARDSTGGEPKRPNPRTRLGTMLAFYPTEFLFLRPVESLDKNWPFLDWPFLAVWANIMAKYVAAWKRGMEAASTNEA